MKYPIIALAALAAAAPVAAKDSDSCGTSMVCASRPQSIADALQAAGYKAKVTKDDTGDPMVSSSAAGYNFDIFFYGCDKALQCDSLQFRVSFTKDDVSTPQLANLWNQSKRFSQAYIDSKGQFTMTYDVTTQGGLNQKNAADVIDWWATMLGNLATFFKEHPAKS